MIKPRFQGRIRALATGLAGTAAVIAAAPAAALAFNPQPDPPGRIGPALMLAQPHHRAAEAKSHDAAANTVYHSTEFAGWAADTPHGLASVSTTFRIPTLNCSTDIDDPLYLGVFTNTGSSYSTIRLLCDGTNPTYTYWLATPAGLIQEPGAAAGDVVVVSMFQTASWTEAEIHDVTNGQYWVADTAAGGTGIDPGIGVNEPYATAPLPPITPATFSAVEVNGDNLGFESPAQYELVRSETLFTSSGLSSTGSKFTVTFKHST
jgi:hypothetical protein